MTILSCGLQAEDLPDRVWLEQVSILAASVRDQTVVLTLPGDDRQLLTLDEVLPGIYDLKLVRVLDHRVEVAATRAGVSDRKVALWFTPGQPGAQIVTNLPDEPGSSPGPVPAPPGDAADAARLPR